MFLGRICQTEGMPAAPFPAPRQTPQCIWRGGMRCAPTWTRSAAALDTAGLHELLRRACLPREELLHMGATPLLLSMNAPALTPLADAARVLGRIEWDRLYGEQGYSYWPIFADQAVCLGHAVIAEEFTHA